jgi:hypothetical protein
MRRFAVLAAVSFALAAPGWAAAGAPVVPSGAWGLALGQVGESWAVAANGQAVRVAVVDSGVRASDPELSGALAPGYDFVAGAAVDAQAAADPFGHGSAVAEVIGGRPGPTGEAVGICWWCTIIPVRVLDASGSGNGDAIAAGIRWAADSGARVINLSVVLNGSIPAVADAIVYAESHDVLVVAAAGNDASDTPSYPASYPGVVAVAAVDNTRSLYAWSRRGAWITLGAPGCSAVNGADFCGTSAAAAFVSGVAALAFAAKPSASAAEVRAALVERAAPSANGVPVVDARAVVSAFVPAAVAPAKVQRAPVKAKPKKHRPKPRRRK